MKHRVLVLGANGFIGRRVVEALTATDWATPIAAGRRLVGPTESTPIERQLVDATDSSQVARALQGVNAVVNCVAGGVKTIIACARALFDAAAQQASQPRIIHLSSAAVYGSAVGDVDESAPLLPDLSPYGTAKIQAEQLAARCRTVVIFRPGIVYGPGSSQWSDRPGRWLLERRVGDLGAMGDGYCNLVYIDDLVTAILQAIRIPGMEGERFNLGMVSPPRWNDYFAMYAIALGAVPVKRISARRLAFEAKALAAPRKIFELIVQRIGPKSFHARAPITPSLLRLWRQELRLNDAKSRSLLSVDWTPLDVGMQRAARWFLNSSGTSR
ncbi:MAG TPA: NAD-dependent epimerase/dehydratase family protein [Steroidobacteraceae bacterium]